MPDGRRTKRYRVGTVSELPAGSRRLLTLDDGRSVGVFNVRGTYYGLRNTCPHQGGPLCLGKVTGTAVWTDNGTNAMEFEWTREGEIIRCPWHRWEFEIATGKTIFPSRYRVKTYDVHVEEHASIPGPVETYPVSVADGLVVLEA